MSVYALLVPCGVVAVDQREGLEHVLDRLDARVGAPFPLVLAPVVVDVAEAALLLGAEVLAEAQHGEVDQVAPLDRRRGLHHRLAVRERVAVVLGHRRQVDVGERAAVDREPERAVLGQRDAVRRAGIDAHRDDRAAERVRPAGQRQLLRRPPSRRLAELRERLLVEREDEVRLRLDLALEVVAERRPSNAMPVRSRSSFSTASGGTFGKRSIRDSRSAVREPEARSLTPSRYRLGTVIARLKRRCAVTLTAVIKLGRISYVNMAPVFHRLEYEVEEVVGVPTELNRMLIDGELDIAPISSIEYARHADTLRLLPRLCVSSEGAVDSIQLVTRMPLGRVRSVAVTPESATSVVLTKVLLPAAEIRAVRGGGGRQAADRRRGAEERLRGPDAPLRPRPALAREDRAADGVRRLGRPRAARRRARRPRARPRRLGAPRPLRAREARLRGERALRLSGRASSPATSRSSATASAPASGPASTRSSRWPATSASSTTCPSSASRGTPKSGCEPTAAASGAADRLSVVDRSSFAARPVDAVAAVDPHARRAGTDRSASRDPARSSSHRGTCRAAHRRDHRVVEPPRRVTEEVDRRRRTSSRSAAREPATSCRSCTAPSCVRSGCVSVWAASSHRGDQEPHLCRRTAPRSRVGVLAPRDRARRPSRGCGGSAPPSRTGCGSRRRTTTTIGWAGSCVAELPVSATRRGASRRESRAGRASRSARRRPRRRRRAPGYRASRRRDRRSRGT